MAHFLFLTSVLLACVQVAGQSASPQAQQTVETIRELRAIGLPNFEAGGNGPPAKVPGLLRKLNHQLQMLITDRLNDQSRSDVVNEREITAALNSAGWKEIPPYRWSAYGEISRIRFDLKSGYDPGILVVSTELWVPCGSTDPEAAIYVFQGRGRNWKLVLATDADFNLAGESGDTGMQYSLSPQDANGNWYLAIAQASPACGPTRSATSLRYKILRPGRSAEEPRVLLDRLELLNEKFEPPFRLEAQDDWFAVTRGKERKLDAAPGVSVARYQIIGDEIKRMQPLALTPEDFLDEWVQLSWNDAARSSGQSSELSNWHSMLNALANDSTEIEFVQACGEPGSADKAWLVGLWIDQELNPSSQIDRLYIAVSEQHHSLFVDSVSTTRPSGCPGNARPRFTSWELPNW